MITTKAVMDSLPNDASTGPLAVLSRFRLDFHQCLTARADELAELADVVLCTDGPVNALAGLSLAPEHQRGHGALYDAVNHGRIDAGRLRRSLVGLPLPRPPTPCRPNGGGAGRFAASDSTDCPTPGRQAAPPNSPATQSAVCGS
jgi:DDE superfamily endonuclease